MNYGERSEEAYLATVAVKEVMQEPDRAEILYQVM